MSLNSPALATPTLARRLCCIAYEGVLLGGVVFIAGYLFTTLAQQRDALHLRHALLAWIATVAGAYFVWFWRHGGQTLPMKTWRIRLVSASGAPLSLGRAVARYGAAWLWWLPPLAIGAGTGLPLRWTLGALGAWVVAWALASFLDPEGQFPHDRLAGTRLVVAA